MCLVRLIVGIFAGMLLARSQGHILFSNSDEHTGGVASLFDIAGTTRLAGPEFLAQLVVSRSIDGTHPLNFTPIGSPAPFQTGVRAGYWNASPDPLRAVPFVQAGELVWYSVHVWSSKFGSTYEELRSSAAPDAYVGIVGAYSLRLGTQENPALLKGFTSQALIPFAVPESSALELLLAGAATMLAGRWWYRGNGSAGIPASPSR